MKTKKLFALGLASLALILSACGTTGGSEGSSSAPSVTPSTSVKDPESVHVTGVALTRNEFSGEIGDSVQLYANVSPSDAFNREVSWKSSNLDVATVKNGLVTIVGKGTATITAKTFDGGFEDTCVVTCGSYTTVVCMADDLVDTYCWDFEGEDIYMDGYAGKDQDGNLYFEYEEGSLVYLLPDYDVKSTRLYGFNYYTIDGELLGYAGSYDYAFYLQLPEGLEYVLVAPVAQEVKVDTNEYYKIANTSALAHLEFVKGMYPQNLTMCGAAGEKVEFTFNLPAGYDFDGFVTVTSKDGDVACTKNAAGNYEFVMPKGDVAINVGSVAHDFGLIRIDEKGLLNTTYVDGEVLNKNTGYAPCDSVITMVFYTNNKEYVAAGVIVTTDAGFSMFFEAQQDGYGVAFYMPCYSITVEVVAVKRSWSVNIVNSDNVQLVPYVKEDGRYYAIDPEEARIEYNGSLYFKVVASDPKYVARSVVNDDFQYVTSIGSTYTSNSYSKPLSVNEDGYYYFTLSYLLASELTFRVAGELDNTAYADSGLAGEYLGIYAWGTNTNFTAASTGYRSTITTGGNWKEGSSQFFIESYNEISHKGTFSVQNTAGSLYPFMYKDGIILQAKDREKIISTYKYVYFKMQEGDTEDLYSLYGETFLGGKMLVVEVLREGVPYKSIVVDTDAQKVYTGVSFDFVVGSHVSDKEAVYDIKLGNNTLYSVGYHGTTGGAANRGFRQAGTLRGNFKTVDGEDMFFDGFNHVTYNGEVWTAEIDANGDALCKKEGTRDTLAFHVVPTLGIISDVRMEGYKCTNPLEGRTFTCLAYRDWLSTHGSSSRDTTGTLIINFVDDTHVTVTGLDLDGANIFPQISEANLAKSTYAINGNKVTIKFYVSSSSYAAEKTWEFTMSADYMTLTWTRTSSTTYVSDSATYYVYPAEPLTGSALNNYVAK